MRENLDSKEFEKPFLEGRRDVATAPGEGLYLSKVFWLFNT